VAGVGETFHHEYTDPASEFRISAQIKERLGFFNLRLDLLRKHPELTLPSEANQALILQAFFRHLELSEGAERYLIDVKYASAHHLDTYWRLPHEPPFLIAELKKRGHPLVHLKRKNLFALLCSQKLAERTGLWHVFADRPVEALHLLIDTASLVRDLDDIAHAQRMFDRWLGDGLVRVLEYESLLDKDGFSRQVQETFADIFGMAPIEPLSTSYRKVTPPLRRVVVNKVEVLTVLKGTPYQTMAEEALG
jgi:hypothetical protein